METDGYGNTVVRNCEALFLSDFIDRDGHTPSKANGTITYIKYYDNLYAITCAHVLSHQKWNTTEKKLLSVFGKILSTQI